MLHARRALSASSLLATMLLGSMTPTSLVFGATADQDFAARCAASGVLVCQGFDNASLFSYSSTQTQGIYPINGTSTIRIYPDTSIKASGASSARFDIPGYTGADATGHIEWGFGKNFGAGSTFYVQYRARFDDVFINTDWNAIGGTSPKLSIFYDGNGLSCAATELTVHEFYGEAIPTMYSECGARSLYTSTSDISSYTSSTPLLLQQGSSTTSGYNCQYGLMSTGTGNGKGCFYMPANTWITFYFKVSIGTWGQANSSIQAFVSVNGGPYQEWINVRNYTLEQNNSSSTFNRVMLTPYMTNMSSSVNHATAHVWYDELIVSTQPIAVPGGTAVAVPNPPTNLTAQ